MRRYGEAIFPVDVLVTFGNGERVDRTLGRHAIGGSSTPTIAAAPRGRRRSIRDRVLLLDVNYTNNSATLEPKSRRGGDASGALKWMVWLQDCLLVRGRPLA